MFGVSIGIVVPDSVQLEHHRKPTLTIGSVRAHRVVREVQRQGKSLGLDRLAAITTGPAISF